MHSSSIRFKKLRKEKGLTQVQMADLLGVSQGTITDIERGKIGVSKKIAEKLNQNFGINTGWILAGEGEINKGKIQGKNTGLNTGFDKENSLDFKDFNDDSNFYLKHHIHKKLLLELVLGKDQLSRFYNDISTLTGFEYIIHNLNQYYFNEIENKMYSTTDFIDNKSIMFSEYKNSVLHELEKLKDMIPAISKISKAIQEFYKDFEKVDTKNVIAGTFGKLEDN